MAAPSPDQLKAHHLTPTSKNYAPFLKDYTLNPAHAAYNHEHATKVLGFSDKELQAIHENHPNLIPTLIGKIGGESGARARAAINGVPDRIAGIHLSDPGSNQHLFAHVVNPESEHFSPLHAQQVLTSSAADLEVFHAGQSHPELLPKLYNKFQSGQHPIQSSNIVQAIHCADANSAANMQNATSEAMAARVAVLHKTRVDNMHPAIQEIRKLVSELFKGSTKIQLLEWVNQAEGQWYLMFRTDQQPQAVTRMDRIGPLIKVDMELKKARSILPEATARLFPYEAKLLQVRKLVKFWLGAFQCEIGPVQFQTHPNAGVTPAFDAVIGIKELLRCCHQAQRLNFHNSKIGAALIEGPTLQIKFARYTQPASTQPPSQDLVKYWSRWPDLMEGRNELKRLIVVAEIISEAIKKMPGTIERDSDGKIWQNKADEAATFMRKTVDSMHSADIMRRQKGPGRLLSIR